MLINKILSLGPLGWHIGIKQTIFGVRKSLDKKDERKELKLMASDFFILIYAPVATFRNVEGDNLAWLLEGGGIGPGGDRQFSRSRIIF